MMNHPNHRQCARWRGNPDRSALFRHGIGQRPIHHNVLQRAQADHEGEAVAVFPDLYVQHAHQKGIIHRDLKPSNVLVTLQDGQPIPKIIDFGVAKATQARLTEKTLFTDFRHMIGTPTYMSPEQAEMSGLDIDTRSDIYSLGVLLTRYSLSKLPLIAKRFEVPHTTKCGESSAKLIHPPLVRD